MADQFSNLLEETEEFLERYGKNWDDVRHITTRDGDEVMSADKFRRLANREYDAGFGGTEVREDLVIVGDGWWIERHEYDGSEWWEYKTLPIPSDSASSMEYLFQDYVTKRYS